MLHVHTFFRFRVWPCDAAEHGESSSGVMIIVQEPLLSVDDARSLMKLPAYHPRLRTDIFYIKLTTRPTDYDTSTHPLQKTAPTLFLDLTAWNKMELFLRFLW